MELLIILYIGGGFLFVFLLYTLEPRGYYWARVRGHMGGVNNLETFKKMLLQDIERARSELLIGSCTADLSHWDKNIIDQVNKRAAIGVKFIFLVGPLLNNTPLQNLSMENKNIEIKTLESNPPCDFRIIDRNGTYVSNHGYNDPRREFYRTFGNTEAVDDKLELFSRLISQAEPYRHSA